jgi:hypothetical protein
MDMFISESSKEELPNKKLIICVSRKLYTFQKLINLAGDYINYEF